MESLSAAIGRFEDFLDVQDGTHDGSPQSDQRTREAFERYMENVGLTKAARRGLRDWNEDPANAEAAILTAAVILEARELEEERSDG